MNGSSPQVRGTPQILLDSGIGWRFIPAGAGNTTEPITPEIQIKVHPRRCGEHRHLPCCCQDDLGSSPQVRGTRPSGATQADHRRFIPAGAGNTLGTVSMRIDRAVHPRRCGEHHITPDKRKPDTGSSPQVRGTLNIWISAFPRSRFIPAGAGNTAAMALGTLVHTGSSPQVRGTLWARAMNQRAARFIPAGAGNTGDALTELGRECGSSPQVRGTHFKN